MRTGRPIPPLELNDGERAALQNWALRPKSAQALATRARMILLCAAGNTNTQVAGKLHLRIQTVGKWRQRFIDQRLDGLLDEPRPGTPRKVSDAEVERVLTMTLESRPKDATHWSTRSLAVQCGLSRSTVSRIWQAFALQPHRSETFKLSKDPLFIEKVRDIVGALLEPARPCSGAVRGREIADSSVGSDPTAAAHAARTSRTPHPRLRAAWHDLAVCRPGC
jgi:transposase